MLVKDITCNIFGDSFIESLPKTCSICGSDIYVSETFNLLKCTNIQCKSKISSRVYFLSTFLGLGLTKDECLKFIEDFDVTNPYSLLMYDPESDGVLFEGCSESKSIEIYKNICKSSKLQLWEYVYMGGYFDVMDVLYNVLKDYTDLDEFYRDLIDGGVSFLQKKIGLISEGVVVKAIKLYNVFVTIREELRDNIDCVEIVEPLERKKIYFVCSCSTQPSNRAVLNLLNNGKSYTFEEVRNPYIADYYYWEDNRLNKKPSILLDTDVKVVDMEYLVKKALEVES